MVLLYHRVSASMLCLQFVVLACDKLSPVLAPHTQWQRPIRKFICWKDCRALLLTLCYPSLGNIRRCGRRLVYIFILVPRFLFCRRFYSATHPSFATALASALSLKTSSCFSRQRDSIAKRLFFFSFFRNSYCANSQA